MAAYRCGPISTRNLRARNAAVSIVSLSCRRQVQKPSFTGVQLAVYHANDLLDKCLRVSSAKLLYRSLGKTTVRGSNVIQLVLVGVGVVEIDYTSWVHPRNRRLYAFPPPPAVNYHEIERSPFDGYIIVALAVTVEHGSIQYAFMLEALMSDLEPYFVLFQAKYRCGATAEPDSRASGAEL